MEAPEKKPTPVDYAAQFFNAFMLGGLHMEGTDFAIAVAMLAGRMRGALESISAAGCFDDAERARVTLERIFEDMRKAQLAMQVVAQNPETN